MPAKLTIASTLYRSSPFVEEFVARCHAVASQIEPNYEIILVDDGSPDDSLQVAKALLPTYPHLRILEFSRNFGHHPAILAALAASTGDLVFFIDSDLEEAPELLLEFHQVMQAQPETDVVYGYHDRQGQRLLRRWTGETFWKALTLISEVQISQNLANVRLMRRRYVDALVSMPDRNVFLGGMFAWPGFKQLGVRITRTTRDDTSYSWRARARLASLAAVSFSKVPLLITFWTGLAISVTALVIGVAVLVQRLLAGTDVTDGWSSIMVSVWFLGGMIMGSIGVVGLYIAQIFDQVRARPLYVVRAEHRADGQP